MMEFALVALALWVVAEVAAWMCRGLGDVDGPQWSDDDE
jgi:hypothetical protein